MLIAWVAGACALAAVAAVTYVVQQKSLNRDRPRRETPFVSLAVTSGEEPELRATRRGP